MINKKGITLSSLVIYIVLFTSFTIFVSSISTNMNERLLDNRGEAINYSSLNKLQYNIEDSSLESNDVIVEENAVSYTNGDNYVYNAETKTVYKNDGILCANVDSFNVTLEMGVNAKKVTIDITFSKYLNSMTRTIISCVEEV